MNKNNIYNKYCTCMQNHGLGAYAIACFTNGYYSINNEQPNFFHIFLILPMILNERIRFLIRGKNNLGGVEQIETLISNKIYNKKDEIGAFYNLIDSYKNYTMTCIIFGLRTGLFQLINSVNIEALNVFNKEECDNHIFLSAYKLGQLFANDKDSLLKLMNATGVNL